MTAVKTEVYEKFHCIADKCPMTCCQGWSIRADGDVRQKWKQSNETAYLCEYTVCRCEEEETIYEMQTDDTKTCLLLDSQGLCEIVKRHGEAYLSDTCAHFPRKQNEVTQIGENDEEQVLITEYSLSGACPAVLELIADYIYQGKESVIKLPTDCGEGIPFPMEYRVRNVLITMIQGENVYGQFSLEERLLLGFSLLHECLDCELEEDVYDCLEVYADEENLKDTIDLIQKLSYEEIEAFEELCQTFWDVTEYYKEEPMYRPYLYSLAERVGKLFPDEDDGKVRNERSRVYSAWLEFKKQFRKYDCFAAEVLAAEIFSDCVSDDLGELTESFQAIVLEYIMTRLAVFLSSDLDDNTVRKYYSLFIRAIGHNMAGMAEYWEENFEDSVLEKEFFYLLLQ